MKVFVVIRSGEMVETCIFKIYYDEVDAGKCCNVLNKASDKDIWYTYEEMWVETYTELNNKGDKI